MVAQLEPVMIERKVTVTFDTFVSREMTEEQLLEWLRFTLSGGGCSNDNPLVDRDIEAEWDSVEVRR